MKATLIQPAKFALLCDGTYTGGRLRDGGYASPADPPISDPAIIDLGGLRLHSDSPISAAHAEAINKAVAHIVVDV